MELRYLLKQGLLPPGLLLWMILLGWCLRRRYPRLARAALLGGLLGLWLMSLPLVVQQSARWLENQPPLSTAQQADLASQGEVIVVLGPGASGRIRAGEPISRACWPLSGCVMRRVWPRRVACRCSPRAACTMVSRPARRR